MRQGWRVIGLHRAGSETKYLERLKAQRVQGDVNDPASLERTIPKDVDALFHVAASIHLWSRRNAEQTRVNVEGITQCRDGCARLPR